MTYANWQNEFIRIYDKGRQEESIVRVLIDETESSEGVRPVFDESWKVFILTAGTDSFYLDIEGNYDRTCGMQIEWSSPPTAVTIARPYLIAFMDENSTIEIKPLAHAKSKQQTQSIALYQSEIKLPFAVSTNSQNLSELDSLYLIVSPAALQLQNGRAEPSSSNFKVLCLNQRGPIM